MSNDLILRLGSLQHRVPTLSLSFLEHRLLKIFKIYVKVVSETGIYKYSNVDGIRPVILSL